MIVCLAKTNAEVSIYCLAKADAEVFPYYSSKLDSNCYSYSSISASDSSWIKSLSNATVTEAYEPWFLDLCITFVWESTILSLHSVQLYLTNHLEIVSSSSSSIILIDLFLIESVLKY